MSARRIFFLDNPECRRGRKENLDVIFGNDAPERAGVRCTDRLAFVYHCGVAVEQRGINNIGVSDDPANIRCGPVNIAGLCPVDMGHAPLKRNDAAARVSNHALWLSGRSRRIQNV